MKTKIGINGFGRIGRLVFRTIKARHADKLEVVAINDLFDARRREVDDGDLVRVVGDEGDAARRGHGGELQGVVDLHRGNVGDDARGSEATAVSVPS